MTIDINIDVSRLPLGLFCHVSPAALSGLAVPSPEGNRGMSLGRGLNFIRLLFLSPTLKDICTGQPPHQ